MSDLPKELGSIEVVRENHRYTTFKAIYKGSPVFVKQVKSSEITRGIQREIWGLEAFRQLSEDNDLGFDVPRAITTGNDFIVTEWVEGKPIFFDPDSTTFEQDIDFFATSLANIDMLTCLANRLSPKFDMNSRGIDKSLAKLKSRLDKVNYSEFIDTSLIDRGFDYIYRNAAYLTARLTHADFIPANLLQHNGRKTLIDYESVNLRWPRFYDLVNLTFNRMAMNQKLVFGCQSIVEKYFVLNSSTKKEPVLPQLNTIAMIRALSIIWEHISEPNAYHNTHPTMSRELGQRLMASMEQMLAGKPYFETFQ